MGEGGELISFIKALLVASAELCGCSFVVPFCPGDCGCFEDTLLSNGNPCGFADSLCLCRKVNIYLNT